MAAADVATELNKMVLVPMLEHEVLQYIEKNDLRTEFKDICSNHKEGHSNYISCLAHFTRLERLYEETHVIPSNKIVIFGFQHTRLTNMAFVWQYHFAKVELTDCRHTKEEYQDMVYISDFHTNINFQNQGYGTRFLKELIDYSNDLLKSPIILETSTTNFPAIRICEKNGFVVDGHSKYPYESDEYLIMFHP